MSATVSFLASNSVMQICTEHLTFLFSFLNHQNYLGLYLLFLSVHLRCLLTVRPCLSFTNSSLYLQH